MESKYTTLQTIFNIVKNDPHPETYLCSPREIILRQFQEWNAIEQDLQLLVKEELIVIKQLDKIAICITLKGIEKSKSLLQSDEASLAFSFGRN